MASRPRGRRWLQRARRSPPARAHVEGPAHRPDPAEDRLRADLAAGHDAQPRDDDAQDHRRTSDRHHRCHAGDAAAGPDRRSRARAAAGPASPSLAVRRQRRAPAHRRAAVRRPSRCGRDDAAVASLAPLAALALAACGGGSAGRHRPAARRQARPGQQRRHAGAVDGHAERGGARNTRWRWRAPTSATMPAPSPTSPTTSPLPR